MCNIKLHDKETSKKLLPITSMYANYCNLHYVENVKERRGTITHCEDGYCKVSYVEDTVLKSTKNELADRIIYRPIFDRNISHVKPVEPKIRLGTVKGNIFHLYIHL